MQDQELDFSVDDTTEAIDLAQLHVQAESDFDAGEYEAALMRYLEVFEGSRDEPTWREKRLTIVLADVAALADVYEPAMQALTRMRDEREASMLTATEADNSIYHIVCEWAALNRQLEPERTLATYFKLKANPRQYAATLELIRQIESSQLIGLSLYSELDRETLAHMQDKLLQHESKLLGQSEIDHVSEEEQNEALESEIDALLKVAIELFEASAALKEGDIGRETMHKYLAYDHSDNSYSKLIIAARKAKNKVWIEGLEKLASENNS